MHFDAIYLDLYVYIYMYLYPLVNKQFAIEHGPVEIVDLPSGKLTQLWKITIFNGKAHYKWSFSIAMLNYQRVPINSMVDLSCSFFVWSKHGG